GGATVVDTNCGIHLTVPKNSGTNLRGMVKDTVIGGDGYVFFASTNCEDWEQLLRIRVTDAAFGTAFFADQLGFFGDEESNVFTEQMNLENWEVNFDSTGTWSQLTSTIESNFFGIERQGAGILLRESLSGRIVSLQL